MSYQNLINNIPYQNNYQPNFIHDNFFDNKLDNRHLNILTEMKIKLNNYMQAPDHTRQQTRARKEFFSYAMSHKKTFLKLCQLGDIPYEIINECMFQGRAVVWNALGTVIPGIDTFGNEIIANQLVLVKYKKSDGKEYGMFASPDNGSQIKRCLSNVILYQHVFNELPNKKVLIRPNPLTGYALNDRGFNFRQERFYPCSILISPMNYSTQNCQGCYWCDGDTAAIQQSRAINNILRNVDDNNFGLYLDGESKANVFNAYSIHELAPDVLSKISHMNINMKNIPTNFGKAKINKIMQLLQGEKFKKIPISVIVNNDQGIVSPMHSTLGGWRLKNSFLEEQNNIPNNKQLVYSVNGNLSSPEIYNGKRDIINNIENQNINNNVTINIRKRRNSQNHV